MQAFLIHAPKADLSAVVFDSPHSGIVLPDHFRYACARQDLMHLHDPHVEKLLEDVPSTGAPVLEALIHRTCIDLNRYDDEIDPAMISGDWPHPVRQTFYTAKKLGLFPAFAGPRANRISAIYNDKARLNVAEAEHRITTYHRPYYAALNILLQDARKAHGHAVHVDVHSFQRQGDMADIILGDGGDETPLCAPRLKHIIQKHFEDAGFHVDFNGTYFSGGALIHATSALKTGQHSIQIEIARDLYMNTETLAFAPAKGAKIKHTMTRLAKTLSAQPFL